MSRPLEWLRELRSLCDFHDILLICDDIQVGCGRTGTFFSFEPAGIVPDLITLSKSISGYGFPMSLLLMRPHLDMWAPGEHTGTFRGNQASFVGARAALEYYIQADIETQVRCKGAQIEQTLIEDICAVDPRIQVRGRGMIWGIDLVDLAPQACGLAAHVARGCYERGLIIETVGRHDTTLKIIPPLTIEPDLLAQGLSIIKESLVDVLTR